MKSVTYVPVERDTTVYKIEKVQCPRSGSSEDRLQFKKWKRKR